MKRYNFSLARERLAEVLNEAERSGSVVIERRDVQYVIKARRTRRPSGTRRSIIETIDPAVTSGQWEWKLDARGVRFSGRRQRS